MQLYYESGVTLRLKQYKFFAETMDYPAHVIELNCLELVQQTTDAVAKLEQLSTPTELRSVPGLCNDFWRFVPNVAHLTDLLAKS